MLPYILLIYVVVSKKIVIKIAAFILLNIYLDISAGSCSTNPYQVVSVYTTVSLQVIMRAQRD